MEHEALTSEILNAAIKVHRKLGPGLLESAYEACLRRELLLRGIKVEAQVPLPITYEGETIEVGYRLDLVVNDLVIVELKAVEKVIPLHEAQIISYLRLSGKPIGLLINFHVPLLKDGVKRFANLQGKIE